MEHLQGGNEKDFHCLKDPCGGKAPKRPRISSADLLELFHALPKDLATPLGDPLAVLLLRFLGNQSEVVACCRTALDWFSIGGQRVVLCLNDECRGPSGPFAPLQRVAVGHVASIRLGRYGRASVEERTGVIVACVGAVALRCVYAKLTGLGPQLLQALPLRPDHPTSSRWLQLRRIKCHQCRLQSKDVAAILRRAPLLEAADFFGEALAGLGQELLTPEPGIVSSTCTCPGLRSIEFTDCGLTVEDAAALFKLFGSSLRSAHFQACNLRGLRTSRLVNMESLSLLDCSISRWDVAALLAQCPRLQSVVLCGNPLGEGEDEDEDESTDDGCSSTSAVRWPRMPHLRHTDFRSCGLEPEEALGILQDLGIMEIAHHNTPPLVAGQMHVPASAASADAVPGSRHIVFDSSDGE